MNEIIPKNTDFNDIYNKSYRLAAAVFMISNVMDQKGELETKIKKLALDLVSMSVKLKDFDFYGAKKLISDIEKNSLELMSMLDIASISGLVSKMNGDILREEFQTFILELSKFSEKFENNKNTSVKGIFSESTISNMGNYLEKSITQIQSKLNENNEAGEVYVNGDNKIKSQKNNNGHKRKDLRKSVILEYIKGHNDVNIKDIARNITGCSEKTIQRELISLIKEGKIKKIGERRWSKYSNISKIIKGNP